MKKFEKLQSLFLALMIAASVMVLASCNGNEQKPETKTTEVETSAEASATETPSTKETVSTAEETFTYTITFICVDAEGNEHPFEIKTNERYLSGALEQENLIEGDDSQYGMMVSKVCGVRADYTLDGAYWALYIGDDYALTGVDTIELVSGTTYKFIYTKA